MKVPYEVRAKRPLLYLITISNLKKNRHVEPCEISTVLEQLCRRLTLIEGSLEIGPYWKQLHFHGIMISKYLFNTSRFYIQSGFKVMFKDVYDYNNAVNYIYKNEFNCHVQINDMQEKSAF